MINRIRKVATVQAGNGESAGAGIKRDKQVFAVNLGKIDNGSFSGLERYIPLSAVEKKTANFTVRALDHGKVFVFDSTTAITATLPAVTDLFPGFEVTFIVEQIPNSGSHKIQPDANDKIVGGGIAGSDGDDVYFDPGSDAVGDSVTLVCDGEDGFYVKSVSGTLSAT